jgi:hypothetical protein
MFPSSIGLSPLDTGHASDLHINTANDPPRNFRYASICPRLDHLVSGRNLMTPRLLQRRPSIRKCAGMLLSLRLPIYMVNLAIRLHSLARSSKRTTERWQPDSYNGLTTASFARKIL